MRYTRNTPPPVESAEIPHILFKAAPRWYQGVFKAAPQFLGSSDCGAFPLPHNTTCDTPAIPRLRQNPRASARAPWPPHRLFKAAPGGTKAYLRPSPPRRSPGVFKAAPRWYQGVFKAAPQFLASSDCGAFPLPHNITCDTPACPAYGRIRGRPARAPHRLFKAPPGGPKEYLRPLPAVPRSI